MKKPDHSIIGITLRLSNGEKIKDIEKEINTIGKKRSKEKGKIWGECNCCSENTVLVKETGMCGPCTFGEADTYNGNW